MGGERGTGSREWGAVEWTYRVWSYPHLLLTTDYLLLTTHYLPLVEPSLKLCRLENLIYSTLVCSPQSNRQIKLQQVATSTWDLLSLLLVLLGETKLGTWCLLLCSVGSECLRDMCSE